MTASLTALVEALLREHVANGHFPSMDRALEAQGRPYLAVGHPARRLDHLDNPGRCL